MKRSQSSMEMAIIFTFLLLGFSLFLLFFNMKVSEIQKNNSYELLRDMSEIIRSEIELGMIAENGYTRSFFIPLDLSGYSYDVDYKNGTALQANYSVFVVSYNGSDLEGINYVFFLMPNISGSFNYGTYNLLTKTNDNICINTCT